MNKTKPKPSWEIDFVELHYNNGLDDEVHFIEHLLASEKKALLEKVEELIYEGTDGVHLVMVDRINKEKFDELLVKAGLRRPTETELEGLKPQKLKEMERE